MSKTKINFHVLNDSMVITYDGKQHTIAKEDDRFQPVLAALRAAKGDQAKLADTIPPLVEIERRYKAKGIELRDGLFMANDEPLPTELESRIQAFAELKLDASHLLKFWDNMKKNPSFNSRQQLFKFLEHNGHPITDDGCFIAYRGVTEDFKDVHTKTFNNKPGSICEMPRQSVDDNPNNTCSKGLHVACFSYAKGFGQKLVEVKVNPQDVVCVPTDYNGTKMRTCKFEVIQECDDMDTSPLRTFNVDEEEENGCPNDDNAADLDPHADCDHECGVCVNKDVKVNGSGETEQPRYAKRGQGGRFVRQAAKV